MEAPLPAAPDQVYVLVDQAGRKPLPACLNYPAVAESWQVLPHRLNALPADQHVPDSQVLGCINIRFLN